MGDFDKQYQLALALVRACHAQVEVATALVEKDRLAGLDTSGLELSLTMKRLELALAELRLHDLFDTPDDQSGP